jgi:cytochrome P450
MTISPRRQTKDEPLTDPTHTHTDAVDSRDAKPAAREQGQRARDPMRSLIMLMLRRGDVARYRGGDEAAYLVNRPEFIKRVLVDNHANYTKTTWINNMFKRAVADGLLTSDGERWRRQRRLIQPAFHRERLALLAASMTRATSAMLDRWEPLAGTGEPIDMAAEMGSLTLGITAKALFSVDISDRADSMGQEIAVCMRLLVSPDQPVFQEAKRNMEELVAGIVEERRRAGVDSPDLLSMLLQARDVETESRLSSRELRDQIITLLLAGYETTANSLAWTWYLLSQSPSVVRRLQAELRRELDGREPAVDDLTNLTYTRMVLDESMRLYPPAWILGRRALAADTLGDHVIPAGSVVAISPYTMHRHPGYWEEPDAFEPTRFTKERSAARAPFTYFPFGGGPRLCIGHSFALMEAQLVIATVAQRFDVELVPGRPVEPERLFVLRPKDGLPMTIRPGADPSSN